MNQDRGMRRRVWFLLQMLLIVSWMSNLALTDAYVSVYALCTAVAVVSAYDNYRNRSCAKQGRKAVALLSVLFSLAVVLANYPLFQVVRDPSTVSAGTNRFLNCYNAVATFLGGIVVAYHTQTAILVRYPKKALSDCDRDKPTAVFFGLFSLFLAQYLVYLLFVVYPGSVTSDSVGQIIQTYTGQYINNHPYWHTQLIHLCMSAGYHLFGSVNAAAATYSFVQSCFMAACFAYAGVTLYQRGIPKVWLYVSMGMYLILPNHFTYSCTMWKDVPFSLSILLMITAMIRILDQVGKNPRLNYGMFCLGLIGSCLMRTNGWFVILVMLGIITPFLWKHNRKMLFSGISCLILTWVMLNPLLSMMGVQKTNMLEALSLPIQQVSRVIVEGGELTQEQTELLDAVVDRSVIPTEYDPNCSDQMKDAILIKSYDGIHVICGHWQEYLKLWLNLEHRYPRQYLEAWIEETKGYWNAGYDYYIYAEYVSDNDFGICMPRQSNPIHNLVKAYCMFTRESRLFEPPQSIGLHVWLTIFLFSMTLSGKRKEWPVYIPLLVILGGLWLGTPVFAEFRYAYPVFAAFPLLLPLALHREQEPSVG